MPLLPLPPGGSTLGGGELPVTDAADVLAEFPEEYRSRDVAPVRDAFCEAFADGFVEYQRRAEEAAAQCDPLRATGYFLEELGEDRGVNKGAGEDDEVYRARIFAVPEIVTPRAIKSVVDASLAPHTAIQSRVFEPEMDGWFVTDGTTEWGAFVGVSPSYPSRLYESDASLNDGDFFDGAEPFGMWAFSGLPRHFAVLIPALEGVDQNFAFVTDGTSADPAGLNEFFVGDGSDTAGAESSGAVAQSVWSSTITADELYASIISAVEPLKGQGMAWTLYVEPSLT